jgi:hypothetical protein
VLTDARRKLAIIVNLNEKQMPVIEQQLKIKLLTLEANSSLLDAQTILAEFTNTKKASSQLLGAAQDRLTQVYKDILPAVKIFQSLSLPNMDGSFEHATEITGKVNALKDSAKKAESKLAKIPDVNSILQSGVKFLDAYSATIQNRIKLLNDENASLSKLSGLIIDQTESLKTQIKTTLGPVVKLKAQLDRQAPANAAQNGNFSAPLSSSHGAKNEANKQRAVSANSPAAVHPIQNQVGGQKAK